MAHSKESMNDLEGMQQIEPEDLNDDEATEEQIVERLKKSKDFMNNDHDDKNDNPYLDPDNMLLDGDEIGNSEIIVINEEEYLQSNRQRRATVMQDGDDEEGEDNDNDIEAEIEEASHIESDKQEPTLKSVTSEKASKKNSEEKKKDSGSFKKKREEMQRE